MTEKSTPPLSKPCERDTSARADSCDAPVLSALSTSRATGSTFTFRAADAAKIFVHRWLPAAAPKAVVQIAHGIAEHGGRYARLAGELTRSGYAVYANDHRGHGRTAHCPEELGFFAERGGWEKCIYDLWMLNRRIASRHPGLPIVLVGGGCGKLKGGRHLQFAKDTPLANLHVTLLDKLGVHVDKLGDSTGELPQLGG